MFKAISRIMRLEPTKIFKGVDLHGNKYFEIPRQKYLFHQREVLKVKRTVEPPNLDNSIFAAVEASKRVPTEWLAWLQWRRRDPPEQGEVESNLAKRQAIKIKAKQLEDKFEIKTPPQPEPTDVKLEQAEVEEWKPK